ncbi:MAG: hypothetical protein HDR08_15825 [Lachnospiraceae bacterium]|nr:hypothetical protein [Lachnospiraceae bacterium]
METDVSRNTLMTHLNTLSRNLAVVSRRELKTRYRKPYYALLRDIAASASAYVKQIALADLRIRQEYLPEAVPAINNAIQASGILKQISAAAYRRQDIQEIEQLALTLKRLIEDALMPIYEKHLGLYLSNECFGASAQVPQLYNHVNGCIMQDGKWIPLDTGKKYSFFTLHSKERSQPVA